MAADDVEFGHVVDLTLGEPSGTELVADAAIGATTLTVDYAGDFEDTGEVSLNGAVLPYTAITYGAAETDPDVITLAAPLAAAAVVDDKVVRMSGGEQVADWLLHVSLGDGDAVDIPIPYEQRAMWSNVDPSTPIPVIVSADLERLVEVPGRAPVLDGAFIDPTSTIPGGQAFSLDAPTATDGYPEDYGWWQVDASHNVLGFWRLVGGAWVQQTVAPVLVGETINGVTITGSTITGTTITGSTITGTNITGTSTITGALYQTRATGDRVEVGPLVTSPDYTSVRFKADNADALVPPALSGTDNTSQDATLLLDTGERAAVALPLGKTKRAWIQLVGQNVTGAATTRATVAANEILLRGHTSSTTVVSVDGVMGTGDVGTSTFRDSVRSAVMGDYAAGAWTAYTPTFTAATTNPTLANFTIAGRYSQRGKTVSFSVVITANAASGYGTGNYTFGLPVTARDPAEVVVSGNQGGPNRTYVGRGTGTGSTFQLLNTNTFTIMDSGGAGVISGTVIRITGTYEAA